jgi:hypothetical protein
MSRCYAILLIPEEGAAGRVKGQVPDFQGRQNLTGKAADFEGSVKASR